MSKPLVSIVVPIYKVEQYLERCLDSIVAQDYQPIEAILVNDGSPDGCGDIMRRYEEKYSVFHCIWQNNSGVSAARNAGISAATGKYVALIDSDDYIEPDFVSGLVDVAEKQSADVVVFSFYFEFPNGGKIPFPLLMQKSMSGDKAARDSLKMLKLPAYSWNKLYRRELFSEYDIQFPPIRAYEDLATVSRVMIKARNVVIANKPYYHYCLRRTGLTGNFGMKNIEEYFKAIEIIRHFIWTENLWNSWVKTYRAFLHTVETQLFIEINIQKNTIPVKQRSSLVRHVRQRLRELAAPPTVSQADGHLEAGVQ